MVKTYTSIIPNDEAKILKSLNADGANVYLYPDDGTIYSSNSSSGSLLPVHILIIGLHPTTVNQSESRTVNLFKK